MAFPIAGLQKTTLLDYPGILASTIFLGGCNFRCIFCHNSQMLSTDQLYSAFSEDELFEHLNKRKNILKGVCITGGEPTLYAELPSFIQKIKKLGFLVKLDTNGTNPTMLRTLLDAHLLDYIAMDIKADEANYAACAGISTSFETMLTNIKDSITLIKQSDIAYEFRTTVLKGFHTADMMRGICKFTDGGKQFVIQNFVDSEHVPNHSFQSFDEATLQEFADICAPYYDSVALKI